MQNKSRYLIPLIIFLAALLLRLSCLHVAIAYAPHVRRVSDTGYPPYLYFHKYFDLARQLLTNDWVETDVFAYSPVYTYFLAVLIGVFDASAHTIAVIQMVLGAVNCVLIYLIAKKSFDRATGIIAGGAACVYGAFILYETDFLADAFGLFLASLSVLTFVTAFERSSSAEAVHARLLWFIAGASLGICAIHRPVILLFLPFAMVLAIISRFIGAEANASSARDSAEGWETKSIENKRIGVRNVKRSFSLILLTVLGCAIPIIPITLQNLLISSDPVLITGSGGYVFYCSNNYASSGLNYEPPPLLEAIGRDVQHQDRLASIKSGADARYIERLSLMDDILSKKIAGRIVGRRLKSSESSRFWLREALRYIRRFPDEFLFLTGRRIFYAFNGYQAHDIISILLKRDILYKIPWLHFNLISPLGIVGMVVALKRWRRCCVLYAMVAAQLLFLAFFYVIPRYRLPLEALMIIFAAFSIRWIWQMIINKRAISLLCCAISLIALFFLTSFEDQDIRLHRQNYLVWQQMKVVPILLQNGQFESAADILEKAIQVDPLAMEVESSHKLLEKLYRILGNLEGAKVESRRAKGILLPSVREEILRRLEADPNNWRAHFVIGKDNLANGAYGDAEREFEKVMLLKPSEPRGHFYLARTLLASSEIPEIEVVARNPSGIEPAIASSGIHSSDILPTTRPRGSKAHADVNKVRRAISEFEISLDYGLKFTPEAYLAHYYLGESYYILANLKKSRDELERAVYLAQDFTPAHDALARVYLDMKMYKEARKELRIVVRQNPRDIEAKKRLRKLRAIE